MCEEQLDKVEREAIFDHFDKKEQCCPEEESVEASKIRRLEKKIKLLEERLTSMELRYVAPVIIQPQYIPVQPPITVTSTEPMYLCGGNKINM